MDIERANKRERKTLRAPINHVKDVRAVRKEKHSRSPLIAFPEDKLPYPHLSPCIDTLPSRQPRGSNHKIALRRGSGGRPAVGWSDNTIS